MPEPTGSPATPPPVAQEDISKISDTLSQLNDALAGITGRLDEFEDKLTVATTPVEPETPAPEWKPKTWDEFPLKAREVALKAWDEKETEKQEQEKTRQQQLSGLQEQIDKDFDTQLTQLEKEGVIPAVKDVKDPNDAGKQARKELFALGIKYNSPDLVSMASLRTDYVSAGYTFDPKEGKLIKSNPRPFGADAPVGSSARSSTGANKPTYKEIHGLSMDEIVRRYGE